MGEIGPDGRIFGSRSGLTVLNWLVPNILPSGLRPSSVNKEILLYDYKLIIRLILNVNVKVFLWCLKITG